MELEVGHSEAEESEAYTPPTRSQYKQCNMTSIVLLDKSTRCDKHCINPALPLSLFFLL